MILSLCCSETPAFVSCPQSSSRITEQIRTRDDDAAETNAERKIVAHIRAQQQAAESTPLNLEIGFSNWLAIGSQRSGATIASYVGCASRAGRIAIGRVRGAGPQDALKAVQKEDPEVQGMHFLRLPANEFWRYLKQYFDSIERRVC